MDKFSEKSIQAEVERLGSKQSWNHLFTLGEVQTREPKDGPGNSEKKWERLYPVLTKLGLRGKTVLDIGCSEGFFSIEAARMGAEVFGIDLDEQRIEKAHFVKAVLQADNVQFDCLGIHDPRLNDRHFDISFALGFLHRTPEIYSTLEILTALSDIVVLEFKTLESDQPVCQWGGGEVKLNKLNKLYFIPSISFVEGILSDFGFKTIYLECDEDSHLKFKRTILFSSKNEVLL